MSVSQLAITSASLHHTEIAFVGSRGIPVGYGGAETFIEELAPRLLEHGFTVSVTCESTGFGEDDYGGITRLHIPAIQGRTLTIPTINDIVATTYLLWKHPEVRLVYYVAPDGAPAALLARLCGKKVVVNTDGIEWKRPILRRPYFTPLWKFISFFTSWYLRFSEWLAVKIAHAVIADSKAIKTYLERSYRTTRAVYIPYGARKLLTTTTASGEEKQVLDSFGLSPETYYLTVGRIVAENNIHLELEGFKKSNSSRKLVIVGNFHPKDSYNRFLERLKGADTKIMFLDPIYDKKVLGVLRKNCFAYIHAYELGGTNPSLLEQMAFGTPIIAYDVPFHREVLGEGGIYFTTAVGLAQCITALENGSYDLHQLAACCARRLAEDYNWEIVTQKYSALFRNLLQPLK
jgi:glycosyltransferase involved in cell wall biosynthesis